MTSKKKPDFIEPRDQNIIDFCRLKTFIWSQYLQKHNFISDLSYYNPKEIYLEYETAIKEIQLHEFKQDIDKLNIFKLILTYRNKYYFLYKINLDIQSKKDEKNTKNNYTFNNDITTGFIYPEILFFLDKPKDLTLHKFNIEHFFCNVKALFTGIQQLKKITLIDQNEYKYLKTLTSSKYSNLKLNPNTITYDDRTFYFFHHPELCNAYTSIYGFKYFTTSLTNISQSSFRLKLPQQQSK